MDAVSLGSFVISAPRFFAGLGLLLLVATAELAAWARRRRPAPRATGAAPTDATWAWNAAFAVFVGARLGFVLENLGFYLERPLGALAFWQGGFSPWWGVAAGVAVTLWSFRRRVGRLRTVVLPGALALGAWILTPLLLTPASGAHVTLPATVLDRLEGGTFGFTELAGRPMVVNLWATWCVPCRRELPQLARADAANPEVAFVYVNQGESRETVAAYLAEKLDVGLSNVVLDRRQEVGDGLGSVGLPTTYFFDAAGNHSRTHVGEISGAALQRELLALGSASAGD